MGPARGPAIGLGSITPCGCVSEEATAPRRRYAFSSHATSYFSESLCPQRQGARMGSTAAVHPKSTAPPRCAFLGRWHCMRSRGELESLVSTSLIITIPLRRAGCLSSFPFPANLPLPQLASASLFVCLSLSEGDSNLRCQTPEHAHARKALSPAAVVSFHRTGRRAWFLPSIDSC